MIPARARRLRAPLLLALALLLAVETVGGLTLFFARVAFGRSPGEALHVLAGALLTGVYAVYQVAHWRRVTPLRARLDYALGLLAAGSMALTLATGWLLALPWWRTRVVAHDAGAVPYAATESAVHNIGGMLVLTFALAHLGAVLFRDRAARGRSRTDDEAPAGSPAGAE